MCVKVIASQRWDVFLRHGVMSTFQEIWSYMTAYYYYYTQRDRSRFAGALQFSFQSMTVLQSIAGRPIDTVKYDKQQVISMSIVHTTKSKFPNYNRNKECNEN